MRSLTQAKNALQPQKIQKSSILNLNVLLSIDDLLEPGRVGNEDLFIGQAAQAPAAMENAADGALVHPEFLGDLLLATAVAQLLPDGVGDLVKDVVLNH